MILLAELIVIVDSSGINHQNCAWRISRTILDDMLRLSCVFLPPNLLLDFHMTFRIITRNSTYFSVWGAMVILIACVPSLFGGTAF